MLLNHSRRIGWTAALVCLGLVIGAPVASAGTFTVTIDAQHNGAGCNLLRLFDNAQGVFSHEPPCDGLPLSIHGLGVNPRGARAAYEIDAPPNVAITGATVDDFIWAINNNTDYGGGTYWAGGGTSWGNQTAPLVDSGFASPYYGIQVICGALQCTVGGSITLTSIALTASETPGPSMTAVGTNNLLYQGSRWIRNDNGDGGWPLTLVTADSTGVCNVYAQLGTLHVQGPQSVPNTSQWHQCPDITWLPAEGATVDTRAAVPTAGSVTLSYLASNAAGSFSSASANLNVDNDPVSISVAPQNLGDAVVGWVGHPVFVSATATAGPSGVAGISCSTDGSPLFTYSSAQGVTVDGTGTHTVNCIAQNNAFDPQGLPATASQSTTFKIDETPPTLSFEPPDPSDPTNVVVDASDQQSGFSGGTILMHAAGSTAVTPLATTTDGRHLFARIDDQGLTGNYVIEADGYDRVGNHVTTEETVMLPLRLPTVSNVSFEQILNPLQTRVLHKRVHVGWHWVIRFRNGKQYRVKQGGHVKTVRIVQVHEQCEHKRVWISPHQWREEHLCHPPQVVLTTSLNVGYGQRAVIHGLLTTSLGVPIPNAPVRLLAGPHDEVGQLRQVASVTTAADGSWQAILPPGPSQVVQGAYDGSSATGPSAGTVLTSVPAKVEILGIYPRHVPWGTKPNDPHATVHISGQLNGGYLPSGGALVRQRIGLGNAGITYGVKEYVTGSGAFASTYTFGPGPRSLVRHYWFQECSLPTGDYPFTPACSRRVEVTVGGAPPKKQRHHRSP